MARILIDIHDKTKAKIVFMCKKQDCSIKELVLKALQVKDEK